MVFQRVKRTLRCGKEANIETLENGTWAEFRCLQRCGNVIIMGISRARIEALGQAKDFCKDVVEPHLGWRSPEQEIILGEQAPGFARVSFGPLAHGGDTQVFHRNTLTVEHP